MRVHNVAGKGRVGRVQVTGWSHSHQYCQKAGGLSRVFIQGNRLKWKLDDQRQGVMVGWRDDGQSDLLLEVSLCSPGGGISSGRLNRLVGHDACGKLLLGPLKAGTGGTVHRMDLKKKRDELQLKGLQ